MKKTSIAAAIIACLALNSVAFAAQSPAEISVVNDSGYMTNAYFHGNPSPLPLAAHKSEYVPWNTLMTLCHGSQGMLKASDPCSFQVYASNNGNPKQYNVAVITLYLSNGHVVNITNNSKKFRVVSNGPAHFELIG